MQVRKRDGRIVNFNKEKIVEAILKAMESTGNVNQRCANRIANEISKLNYLTIEVEEIQDIVEDKLMASSAKDVAKAYILYRNERTKERNWNSNLTKAINKKLMAKNIENANANVDEASFGGRMGEAANELTKQFALDYCMSEMSRNNHLNNEIYIHDLSHYALGDHNCLSIPFDDLLAKGFNTRQTDVRPANSISTAFQLVAVIFQLQSLMQFGGVSATHLDWTMVPYVRKSFWKHFNDGLKYIDNTTDEVSINSVHSRIDGDFAKGMQEMYPMSYAYAMEMTERELKQAAEGLLHNLNTLQSRSGN